MLVIIATVNVLVVIIDKIISSLFISIYLLFSAQSFFISSSFVVDMRRGTYRQKCHDSDCRTFQGIERTLPKNVTPWLMILDDQWDDEENH